MSRPRRSMALLGALVLAVLVLAACGGDHASAPPNVMPGAAPSAHESVDPRPAMPTALPERDAGGDAAAEAGPPPIVLVADAGSASASVVNPEAAVSKLGGKLRRCYQRGLAADRQMKGKLVISLEIDSSGAVTSANATQNDGISPGVVSCLIGVLHGAVFTTSPPNSRASVQVPLLLRDIH